MSKIKNYADLLTERKRLEEKIIEQHAVLNENLLKLKETVSPFLYLLPTLTRLKNATRKPLLSWIMGVGFDLLLNQNTTTKSNWITRLLALFTNRNPEPAEKERH